MPSISVPWSTKRSPVRNIKLLQIKFDFGKKKKHRNKQKQNKTGLKFLAIAMFVCRQTIAAKVSHQNWCKVSQQKPWSYVVRQSPQKFHTRTGAEFHSKSHGRMSSDNHRKSFTPELVQSFTAKAMFVCRQTIAAKVSHQNWCKVSQQKPCLYVVRQSPQKFHTRTGAKFHSKSHGRISSDNRRKSFTPELVQSIATKAMFVCRQTITAKVSHQNWCKISQ